MGQLVPRIGRSHAVRRTAICCKPGGKLNRQLDADNLRVMNAEYKRHKRVWQMLEPLREVRPKVIEPFPPPAPLTLPLASASFGLSLAMMDPVALAHGVRELSSPLSE